MLLFRAATALLLAGGLWWLLAMSMPPIPMSWWPTVAPPSLIHALLMNLGVMPLFMVGFVLAPARRPDAIGAPGRGLAVLVAVELAGWAGLLWGVYRSAAWATAGLAAVAVARSALAGYAWTATGREPRADAVYRAVVAASLVAGAAAAWAAVAGMGGRVLDLLYASLATTTWWSLAPLCGVVLHRLATCASGRPLSNRLLVAWVAGLVLQFPLTLLAAGGGWPAWGAASLDLALACALLAVSGRLLRSASSSRLLSCTAGLAFGWCGMALLLQAMSIALANLTPIRTDLGLAPLHALTLGFFGCTVLAVVLNSSQERGHRAASAGKREWLLLGAFQLAIVLRLLAEWWWDASHLLLPLAMLTWLGAMLLWMWPHLQANRGGGEGEVRDGKGSTA